MHFASVAVLQLCALASQAVEAGCARRDATGAVGCAVQAVKKVMSPLRYYITTAALTSSLPSFCMRVGLQCSLLSLPDCAQQIPSQAAAWL